MARIQELNQKEVINIHDGIRIGFVSDVEVDTNTGYIIAIIVQGNCKVFNLFGKDTEYIIPWCEIKTIGEDIILVDVHINNLVLEK